MRCADVVSHLQRRLPLLTDLFSDTVAVSSIVHAGTTATVTTAAAHGLAVGQAPTIFGARTPVAVVSITHAAQATVAVVTTAADHDLTLYRTFAAGNFVEVDGANEAEFEGVRRIVAVRNRRTIEIEVDPSAPAAATGTIRLLGASSYLRNVRGRYAVVSVPSPTVFTLTHDAATDLGTLVGPAVVRTPARITGAINEAAAGRSYSLEAGGAPPKPWAFVVLGEQGPVRQREAPAEALAVNMLSGGWSQYVVQPFRVLVALPSTSDERGRTARDQAADLVGTLCRSLLGASFPTGFARSMPSAFVQFAGEESQQAEPGAYYLHAYDFQQIAQVGIDDTVQNEEHVAFRDIDVQIGNDVGDGLVDVSVDLDEVPL